jgi:hypothetical protein
VPQARDCVSAVTGAGAHATAADASSDQIIALAFIPLASR